MYRCCIPLRSGAKFLIDLSVCCVPHGRVATRETPLRATGLRSLQQTDAKPRRLVLKEGVSNWLQMYSTTDQP